MAIVSGWQMAAKKERLHGTGSVYYRESDGKWVGAMEAGWTAKGTRRRIVVTARTESEAEAKLRARRRKIANEGLPAAGTSARTTVKTWAERWLEDQAHDLRPTTLQSTASQVRNWIIPTIGHRRLEQLTPDDVRAVHRAMATHDLAASTIVRAHATLQRMLKDAILADHQVRQSLLLVEGPGVGESDRDSIPLPDALAILAAAGDVPDSSRWVAALLQGMRPAECLGLTWSMIDFDAEEIDVSWQLKPLPYRVRYDRDSGFRVPTGYVAKRLEGAYHLVRPKTSSGRRIIPLVSWMAESLAAWRKVAPRSPHGLVWPAIDGRPRIDKDDRAAWVRLQDAARVARLDDTAGRRYALYEARHTTATLLRAAGVDEETIVAIMGHATILSTKAYLHSDGRRTRAALEGVAAQLGLTAAK